MLRSNRKTNEAGERDRKSVTPELTARSSYVVPSSEAASCEPSDEAPDEALLSGLRAGNADAFTTLYERYKTRLYAFLLRMSGQRQIAEDLLQETWIRLARSASRLEPRTDLRAWLFAVARNLFRSHYRWSRLDSRRLEELAAAPTPRSPPTPRQEAAASQAERRISAAILRLGTKHREVVLLVGMERLSPSEAADILGVSPEVARKRLSRARSILRKELDR